MTAPTTESHFPEDGIKWQGWSDDFQRALAENPRPVFLFVPDPDPLVWPFLREIFKAMPANARLRALLHEFFPALFIKVDQLPEELKAFGAGSRYHIAILSPYGFNPLVTFDPTRSGNTTEVVNEIVAVLERLLESWR